MRTYQMIVLFVCLVNAYGNSIGGSVNELLTCLKFDFEEKLLEKVIRNDIVVQMNQEKMTQWEKRIDAELKHTDNRIKVLHEDVPLELDLHKKKVNSLIFNVTSLSENISSIIMNKQDVALKDFERNVSLMSTDLHKTLTTNENKFNTLVQRIHNETKGHQQTFLNMYRDLQLNNSLLSMKLKEQQNKSNELLTSYIDDIASGKNRVVITACATDGTYSSGNIVKFSHVNTERGTSSAVLSALANTGIFTCKTAGLYLISVFIGTNKDIGRTCLYKNNNRIATIMFSVTKTGSYQTNSVTVVENLKANDKLDVKQCLLTQYIAGGTSRYSCISIVQLTS